ncbi:SpoIID/LytB domain-containing protein [Cyanothece sp. BG0011]|uniref:SpoIID/LytB domain-containing protein n=1 Tax=Cyanothece sp. BG0011 TaxID=2082950 RepID=UPI000D1DD638|nr:SpoIID/LytB domain-containing protein [Cyanothece sp. BG0011]
MTNVFTTGKKLLKNWLVNRPQLWGVPLVCAVTVPLIITRWQPSGPLMETEPQTTPLPPLSQLDPSGIPENSRSPRQGSEVEKPYLKQPSQKKPEIKTQDSPEKSIKSDLEESVSSPPSPPSSPPSPSPPSSPKALAPAPVDYQPPPLEIRVAILRDAPNTTIGVSGQGIVSDRHNQQLKTLSGSQGWNVTPNGGSLSLGGQSLPGVVWVQPTEGSLIYVGDRWYRGKILLVSQGNSLLVVNHVNFEQYLYSVVGSEMHANAPTEALKAQAIAARSYALVHMIRPASAWYDLGNTQRWQVYKGLNSEYNTGHHAVRSTKGQILSHQGGVVESLYAATDEIVARAHKGRGMSQIGAYELARKGYDYQQILDHYYPGVGLARLILSN